MLAEDSNRPGRTLSSEDVNEGLSPLILLVEDHADTRCLYRYVLEAHSYRVMDATNGIEAINLTKSTCPNLILMDSNLPEMDGLSATRNIRELLGDRHVPIVFLSGEANPHLRKAALDAGGDEYLVKPINLDELEAVVSRLLFQSTVEGTAIGAKAP